MKPDDLNSAHGKRAMKAMIKKKTIRRLLLGSLVIALPACKDLTSPNFNFGDVDELVENPSRASTQALAQGLFLGSRLYMGTGPNDILTATGLMGRESYNHDNQDPRFESEYLRGPLNASSPAFGGNFWAEQYANIKLGQIVLASLDVLPDDPANGFTVQEKEYLRGFVKTFQAADFLWIVNTRDETCGCPITIPEGTSTVPEPTVGKDQVFGKIVQLLDEAKGHFAAAGSVAPPIALPSGFDGIPGTGAGVFQSAAGMLGFSRGLRARVAVYTGDFSAALSALAESFLDTGAALEFGVYYSYSPLSGDLANGYFQPSGDPNLRAHPSILTDAELQADGVTLDDRFVRKTRPITSRSFQGLCTEQSLFPICEVGFNMYLGQSAPIPWIRNEELILLRAEANIGLGNLGAALTDINFIRTTSGKLAPLASLGTPDEALDELLYNKRYSLLWEGHRWIDTRRYGKFDTLPLDLPGHQVNPRYPIPIDEQLARGGG